MLGKSRFGTIKEIIFFRFFTGSALAGSVFFYASCGCPRSIAAVVPAKNSSQRDNQGTSDYTSNQLFTWFGVFRLIEMWLRVCNKQQTCNTQAAKAIIKIKFKRDVFLFYSYTLMLVAVRFIFIPLAGISTLVFYYLHKPA